MRNKAKTLYLIPYSIWIALFVIFPIILVVYYSFIGIDGQFTLANYSKFFTPVYLKMTLSSFWYAFLITAISLISGE